MRGLEGRSATGGHLDGGTQRGTCLEGEATPVTALAGWDVTAEGLALAGALVLVVQCTNFASLLREPVDTGRVVLGKTSIFAPPDLKLQ